MTGQPKNTILVIEDDRSIRQGLVDALTFAEYSVIEAATGRDGLAMALESTIDLVLLDVMLPALDGFAVLREIRSARPTLPIIMLTARGSEDDRVRGLTDGADDYVVKPFSALEVLARIEAVLRRSPERPSDVHRLRIDNTTIDLDRQQITYSHGESCNLTEREAAILRYLATNRGRAVDRNELLHRVWGLNPRGIETRTVDMQVARLREKLKGVPTNGISDDQQIIRTVRGKGYCLAEHVEVDH